MKDSVFPHQNSWNCKKRFETKPMEKFLVKISPGVRKNCTLDFNITSCQTMSLVWAKSLFLWTAPGQPLANQLQLSFNRCESGFGLLTYFPKCSTIPLRVNTWKVTYVCEKENNFWRNISILLICFTHLHTASGTHHHYTHDEFQLEQC